MGVSEEVDGIKKKLPWHEARQVSLFLSSPHLQPHLSDSFNEMNVVPANAGLQETGRVTFIPLMGDDRNVTDDPGCGSHVQQE